MTRVIATGVFDIVHPGHLKFLEEARKLGDELIVIVARDKNIKSKGRPIIPEEQRRQVVESLKWVDKAVLGDKEDIYKPVQKLKPDIIALGYDQQFSKEELEKELGKRNLVTQVLRIKARDERKLASSRAIVEKIRKG